MHRSAKWVGGAALALALLACGGGAAAAQKTACYLGGGIIPPVGDVEGSFFAIGAEFTVAGNFTVGPMIYLGDYVAEEAEVDKDDGEFTFFGVMFRYYSQGPLNGFYLGGMVQFIGVDYDDYDWNSVTETWYYDERLSDLLIGPSFILGGKIQLGGGVVVDPNFQIGFSVSTEDGDTSMWGALGVNVGVVF